MNVRIAGIVNDSIVDGPGIRLTVFFQGCIHHCLNCHNPETHNLTGGYLIDTDEIITKLKNNPLLDGITLSGGDPMLQRDAVIELTKKCKEFGLNTICYTGYTYEELLKFDDFHLVMEHIDYLIDGRYIHSLRDLSLKYRGSSNQRIIDVQKSIKLNEIVVAKL